jgi:CubicO group peptidase (beta-lactamase class C family)
LRSKILLRTLVPILCSFLSLFAVQATAQTALDAAAIEHRTDQWLKPYVAAGDFSGVVLIAQGDRILFKKAYGKADFQKDISIQVETRFRIASLSKTFTAAAIELLIAQGKLSLKDPLSKYVSGIQNADKITVEHLLLHESGVGEIDDAERFKNCLSNEQVIRMLQKVPPLFAPGTDSQYSNEGYFLLAVIIEKVSGIPYGKFLQKNIFDPLKLQNTGSACLDLPPGPNAKGNVPGAKSKSINPLPFDEATIVGPGSLYSTAPDLYVWLKTVDTNQTFQTGHLAYPYGWGKRNYSGRNLIEQSGIHEGFNSHMALYPQEHLYAVLLSNIQSGLFNRIPKDLEAVLFGGEPSKPIEVNPEAISAEALEEYTGRYKAPEIPIPQNLVVQNGELFTRWGNYPFLRALTPVAKDEFFFRCEYAQVRFEREAGKIVKMVWQWPQGNPITFTPVNSH